MQRDDERQDPRDVELVALRRRVAELERAEADRRRVQEAARESELRFRRLVESNLIGFLEWTAAGDVLDANDELLRIVASTREELCAGRLRWLDLTPREYLPLDVEALYQLRASGVSVPFVKEYRRRDGSRVSVLIGSASLVPDASRGVSFVLDLTEQRRSEEALRHSRRLLAAAERLARTGSWECELATGRITWSDEQCRIHGLAPGESPRRPEETLAYVHEEDRERTSAMVARALRTREPVEWDLRVVRTDGSVRLGRGRLQVEVDDAGRPVRLLGTTQDVTEQRQAEEALQRSEAALRRSQELAHIGSYVLHLPESEEDYWSEETYRLLGLDPARATRVPLQRVLAEFLHPDDRERGRESLERAVAEGQPWDVEFRIRRPDGEIRWLRSIGAPVRDEQGRMELDGTLLDVTERRELERQLLHAQKMEAVGQLAGGVAHDFNNLLTVIGGYCEALLEEVPKDGELHEMLEEIQRAGERAAELTRELLAFGRRTRLAPVSVDLNGMLREMERMLRRVIGEDVDLEVHLARELGPVRIDPARLEQVILNLAVNARDAMPDGGRLVLETRLLELRPDDVRRADGLRPGRYATIAVTDTGHGMDEATRARVFEPFFTTKEVGRGTGLGLSTAFGFLKQSGGHIEVVSEPGQGSTFRLYLPHGEAAPSVRERERARSEMPGGSETVLLAEDESSLRELLAGVLRGRGYAVLAAGDGLEALQAGLAHPGAVDLLVADVVMPRLGGVELASRLRAKHPAMRVLFVSGYSDDAALQPGIEDGATDFLQKPFAPGQLARKIRALLDA